MPSLTPTEIKTYAVHDHWTDINKKNDVDIISIDGEITRIKVNGEDYGGGGETWNTVFEGDVTTEVVQEGRADGMLDTIISANTIKVTFNGTEYTCEKDEEGYYGASYDRETSTYDWSVYPFGIIDGDTFITQTANTYTLKIEEPQSGGSSDFSTAEVTLSTGGLGSLPIASILDNKIVTTVPFFIESFEAILYKGSQVCNTSEITGTITVSGDAVYDSDEQTITITGDCTITIS